MNLKYIREYNDFINYVQPKIGEWDFLNPQYQRVVSLDFVLNLSKTMKYENMNKNIDYKIHQKRIKWARKENGYTQARLASILNTDNGVISRYESGKTLILTSFLLEYCKIFNLSADYLMGRIDEKIKLKEPITT